MHTHPTQAHRLNVARESVRWLLGVPAPREAGSRPALIIAQPSATPQRSRRMRSPSSTRASVWRSTLPQRASSRSTETERTASHIAKLRSRTPPSGGSIAT
jgi:hypothetical protein